MTEIFALLLKSAFFGCLAGCMIATVVDLLASLLYYPFQKKKELQYAINNGRVVKARLVSCNRIEEDLPSGSSRIDYYIGKYQYEWDEKVYKREFRADTLGGLEDEITLYFGDDPKYASEDNAYYASYNHSKKKLYIGTCLIVIPFVALLMVSQARGPLRQSTTEVLAVLITPFLVGYVLSLVVTPIVVLTMRVIRVPKAKGQWKKVYNRTALVIAGLSALLMAYSMLAGGVALY